MSVIAADDWAAAVAMLAPDVTYGNLTKERAEALGYYECVCGTAVVLVGGPPSHGDVISGHCQVCFRTTGQRRSRQRLVDNARKYCSFCRGWVDKAHFKARHAAKHANGDEGTGSQRRVDWHQSLRYRGLRRPRPRMELPEAAPRSLAQTDLPVEPSCVFWAAESVELTILLHNPPLNVVASLVESQPRLEIYCEDDSVLPGFAALKFQLLFQHAVPTNCCLRFWGFNSEFAFFNGRVPSSDIRAHVRLVSSALPAGLDGHITFYCLPRTPADHLRLQCRQLAIDLAERHSPFTAALPHNSNNNPVPAIITPRAGNGVPYSLDP